MGPAPRSGEPRHRRVRAADLVDGPKERLAARPLAAHAIFAGSAAWRRLERAGATETTSPWALGKSSCTGAGSAATRRAISAASMRPGDVLRSRKGLSVEIGNTDAEGRLILADALALADEETPELLFDFATLTGAARVALGPDLPPYYTDDEPLAAEIASAASRVADPLWRMPLWRPYESMLESPIADLDNAGSGGFAGSIAAALFLARFVVAAKAWAHFDVYAWNPKPRAHAPQGGDVQAARAVFSLLESRYRR